MNIKEIKDLIEAVSQYGITELEVERGGVRVRIRKEGKLPVVSSVSTGVPYNSPLGFNSSMPAAASQNASSGLSAEVPNEEATLFIVRSPIVGTFYRSPTPVSDPFVKVGETVESGKVLCIIEAMKLMNEIEAEVTGEVTKVYVENGEPVEFGQALFGIRPSKKN